MVTYLAYAFSMRAAQNSLGEPRLEQKTRWPSLVGSRSSTTTSTQCPNRQNENLKIPEVYIVSKPTVQTNRTITGINRNYEQL